MQATVISVRFNRVDVRIRNTVRTYGLDLYRTLYSWKDFTVGETLEVKREANNPFVLFVNRIPNPED